MVQLEYFQLESRAGGGLVGCIIRTSRNNSRRNDNA
jgi:hypothetical protein